MGIAILRLSGRVRKNTVEGEGKIATFFGVRQQGCAGPKPFDHNPSFSESHFLHQANPTLLQWVRRLIKMRTWYSDLPQSSTTRQL